MEITTFLDSPTSEIAQLVRKAGTKVCVFPINGTRRWFVLEHFSEAKENFAEAYFDISQQRSIDLYKLFFDYGMEYLLTPTFGPDLLKRGAGYVDMVTKGLERLANHSLFLDFYQEYDVRVRFYGDHHKYFHGTPYAYLSDLFDEVTEQTQKNERFKLFYGFFADDPAETIAAFSVEYHSEHGHIPDKQKIIEGYYGEVVPPVDIFIGFDKFSAFDMPLVSTGEEDLYFTVSPSPYLTEQQLRRILYDHLYMRRGDDIDYMAMTQDDRDQMQAFYHANRDKTLGVGAKHERLGYWYPLPEVVLKAENDEEE